MVPSAIISPKPNGPECFSTISAINKNDQTFIIYQVTATGDQIHIYDKTFRLIQQIVVKRGLVSCVSIQQDDLLIAAAVGNMILFYYPGLPVSGQDLSWKLEFEHQYNCKVKSLDWDRTGRLLVGGTTLNLFRIKLYNSSTYKLLSEFNVQLPFEPRKCVFSPCSNYFGVCGDNQLYVMIWYHRLHGYFDYLLLPHTVDVVNFEWRVSTNPSAKNVVMTSSLDKVARLWTESDQGYGFKSFDLSGVVDPSRYLYGGSASPTNEDNATPYIHWLTGTAVSDALKWSQDLTNSDEQPSKLLETLAEYPDMVFQIQKGGAMTIWGIQGLGDYPRKSIKVIVLIRTENTVVESDLAYFNCDLLSICLKSKISKHDLSEIALFCQSQADDVLNVYGMNLDDFFSHNWNSPRLCLLNSWCGPRQPLKSIKCHPFLPLVALQDSENDFAVFDVAQSKMGLRSTFGLSVIATCSQNHSFGDFVWIPIASEKLLLAFNTNVLSLYSVNTEVVQVASARGKNNYSEVFAYPVPTKNNHFLIMALDSTKQISVWKLEVNALVYNLSEFGNFELENMQACYSFSLYSAQIAKSLNSPSILASLNNDGQMTFWQLAEASKLLESPIHRDSLVKIVTFPVEDHADLKFLKFASFGKVAGVFLINNQEYVRIWDNEFSGLQLEIEGEIKVDSSVLGLDWFTATDGRRILAVGLEKFVQLYIRSVKDYQYGWKQIFSIPVNDTLKSMGWLPNGSLLISSTTETRIVYSQTYSDSVQFTKDSIFDALATKSGRLVDHDPELMINYSTWGKQDLVKFNLSLLHKLVKTSLEKKQSIFQLPMTLWKVLESDTVGSKPDDFDSLFGIQDEASLNELGVFSKAHVEYLKENVAESGLSNHLELKAFVEAFDKTEDYRRSLDLNGLRYCLSAIYQFKLENSPDISSRAYVWAYFSDSQEGLKNIINDLVDSKLLWSDAKKLGMGWWLSNASVMRDTFENIARNQYRGKNGSNDPVDCSLFYLALNKKSVLLGLWKLASSHPEQGKMAKFLSNDFNEDRWKEAALKNAYALLGKQRYEYAAAFFLLAGRLKDAVGVCLKSLKDPQLAICLCRLNEGENGPVLNEIIQKQLLPEACNAGDRWMSIVLYSLINDRESAFYAVMRPLESLLKEKGDLNLSKSVTVADPNLILLYDHFLLYYKKLILKKMPSITPTEMSIFCLKCAKAYDVIGCQALAILLLRKYNLDVLADYTIVDTAVEEVKELVKVENKNQLDWSAPAGNNTSADLDWGELESKNKSSGIDWGEMEIKPTSTGLDWGELESKPANSGLDWGELETKNTTSGLDWSELESKRIEDLEKMEKIDDEPAINELSTNLNLLQLTEEDLASWKVRISNLDIYKRYLILRLLSDVHYSADLVLGFGNELKSDLVLNDYFGYLKRGFSQIGTILNVPTEEIVVMIKNRCLEVYNVSAFVNLMPFDSPIETYVAFAETLFLGQTNLICQTFFGKASEGYDENVLSYVNSLSLNLLTTWMQWNEKTKGAKTKHSEAVLAQVLVPAFTIQLILAAHYKRYNRLWWIYGLNEQFFDMLLKDDHKGLINVLHDALTDQKPIAHPDNESGPKKEVVECFDEFGMPIYPKSCPEAIVAEDLVCAIILDYFLMSFVIYIERVTELMNVYPEMDETYGFLTQTLLKNFSSHVLKLNTKVANEWNTHEMNFKTMPAYVIDSNVKDLWNLLYNTGDAVRVGKSIVETNTHEQESPLSPISDNQDESVVNEILLKAHGPISHFAVNPLDLSQIAYASGDTVCEVDSVSSTRYYEKSMSRASINILDDPVASKKVAQIRKSTTIPLQNPPGVNHSVESLNQIIRRSFAGARKRTESINSNDKGLRIIRKTIAVTSMESHKALNFFLVGSGNATTHEAQAKLFQFGLEQELVTYAAPSEGSLTCCRFDPYGSKFGGSDSRGDLFLWKFDSIPTATKPCITLKQCHNTINEFTFLNSSSILATGGSSQHHMNVSIFDTLLPPAKSRVQSYRTPDSIINSITFAKNDNLVLAAGKKGMLFVIDIRKSNAILNSISTHESSIRSLAMDQQNGNLFAGYSNGEIKIWDIKNLTLGPNPEFETFTPWIQNSDGHGIVQIQYFENQLLTLSTNGYIYRSTFASQ